VSATATSSDVIGILMDSVFQQLQQRVVGVIYMGQTAHTHSRIGLVTCAARHVYTGVRVKGDMQQFFTKLMKK